MKTPAVLTLAAAITLNAAANVLMKVSAMRLEARGTAGAPVGMVGQYLEPVFLGGLVCFALALVAYRRALQTLDLSLAYPLMTSLGYLLVLGVSWLLLREVLSPRQLLGCGVILAGVWLVAG